MAKNCQSTFRHSSFTKHVPSHDRKCVLSRAYILQVEKVMLSSDFCGGDVLSVSVAHVFSGSRGDVIKF